MSFDNKNSRQLYFIAVIPDMETANEVDNIKKEFEIQYHSKAARKSPPHITLIPPFYLSLDNEVKLTAALDQFCQHQCPFEIALENFNCFAPRVIFINVLLDFHLQELFTNIQKFFKSIIRMRGITDKGRRFKPHMTVAIRDLSDELFHKAWNSYKDKIISFSFTSKACCLLKHNGKSWDIIHTSNFHDA